MTRHTDCHAGQQKQPSLARRVKTARNRQRRIICQQSDQVGLYLSLGQRTWYSVSWMLLWK